MPKSTHTQQSSSPSGAQSSQRQNRRSLVIAIAAGVVIVMVMCLVVVVVNVASFFTSAFHPTSRPPYVVSSTIAHQQFSIGQMYNGQVVLNDPRYIGVDRNGNIYAGDFDDGRIDVFDAAGKFLRQINIGDNTTLRGMAVAPDGTVYSSQQGRIHRLDVQGNETTLAYSESSNSTGALDAIALGADGSLVAADDSGDIIRFGPDGTVNLVLHNPFNTFVNEADSRLFLAVDGSGNIFALGEITDLVLKFSPEGKYLSQFGGTNRNHVRLDPDNPAKVGVAQAALDPGHFAFPTAIAVDGYGRVWVSDALGVQVFDANEKYLDFFLLSDNAQGMVFDPANNLYIVSDTPQVIKLAVKKP